MEIVSDMVAPNRLDKKLLCDMMPVQDGEAEDPCHRNDNSEQNMQSDDEDNIVPSLPGRPISQLQEGLIQEGTFCDVRWSFTYEPKTLFIYQSKSGRQNTQ